MKTRVTALVALLGGASIASAQLTDCNTLVGETASAIIQAKSTTPANDADRTAQRERISDALSNLTLYAACSAQATSNALAWNRQSAEVKRTDVQAGAGSGSSGTTTAVSSASKPNFLGLALEDGTTTQTTSGASTTVSINPWKFVDSLAHDFKAPDNPNGRLGETLRRLSFSITMNASTNSTSSTQSTATSNPAPGATASTPFTLLTQLKQVSDFTAHFDIINNRDPTSGGIASKIHTLKLDVVPVDYFSAARALGSVTFDDTAAEAGTLVTFTGDITAEITRFVNQENDRLAGSPRTAGAELTFAQGAADLIKRNKAFYSSLAKSPTLSVEYSLDRQPMVAAMATGSSAAAPPLMATPDLQTARLIHAYSYYTFNASASFFSQKTPTMPDHWRDLQVGLKFDFPFSGISNLLSKGAFEVSGLFVNLHQMPLGVDLMVNGVSVTQPGKIGLFQAKYTIGAGSSGVQVPISITYSNRTDLIKETSIQGNIGITWDMSKLVASKQASSQ